ncbi:NADH-quinone oxidoreductase subunit NuoK [Thermodesulfobacteriota bacterium]
MVTLNHFLVLSALLFFVGMAGVLIRRNLIIVLMCLELMLNAVNLTFIAFSRYLHSMEGQVFVLFVMVVAAAEVAIGLAIAVSLYRQRGTIDINDFQLMKR